MKYFVTHGQGLDGFVRQELIDEHYNNYLDNYNVSVYEAGFPGKFIFSVEPKEVKSGEEAYETSPAKLLIHNLKAAERLFGLLFFEKENIFRAWNDRNPLSLLYSVVGDHIKELSGVIEAWAKFQDNNVSNLEDADPEGAAESKRPRKSYSFRVNVKISGMFRGVFRGSVPKCIGTAILKNLSNSENWSINLRDPTIEIAVSLSDEGIICGIPVCKKPLSERDYLNTIPLRSTIAYCMASLAIEGETKEPGSLKALDPMCGSCTILVELVKSFPQVMLAVGIDNDSAQVTEALNNISKSSESSKVMTILGDSRFALPFRSNGSFDCVLCDLPFGMQHLSPEEVTHLLPKVFESMNSAVKVQGNIVLLMSSSMSSTMEQVLVDHKLVWKLEKKYPVKLGELHAIIYRYKKIVEIESVEGI